MKLFTLLALSLIAQTAFGSQTVSIHDFNCFMTQVENCYQKESEAGKCGNGKSTSAVLADRCQRRCEEMVRVAISQGRACSAR